MKNIRFNNLLLLGLVIGGVLMGGCKKDEETLVDCLVAPNWFATSFTEDGVELIGAAAEYSSFTLDFREYNNKDKRGIVVWTLIENGGGTLPLQGTYSVLESTSEVDITFAGYLPTTFKVTCVGKRLTLNGNLGGFKWIIEASR